ncbi:EDD domain protein [Sporanaerobium hydrogeniformans]|uniref:EDD domain protein n=1 Tax=Sporanaerobium hydrogeniformans TaxID=3072179 RepID=A0AC61DEQ3_9FIRM|nr:DegV family protein [Sporanaerobium hydrogeniformans]PHV71671.1 EDD domain protein [Sporanaerobium hydrogeniformans]
MSEIVLLSDSSCDLPELLVKEYNVQIIPFYVSFDQTTYYKEITELTIPDFYAKLRKEKIFPKTSLPAINDYVETFKPLVAAGKSIICVNLSAHFSGSHNAALNARELILENYPNAQIAIINSLNATAGQGLLVQEIGRMIADGLPFDTIVQTAEKLRESARIFFFVESLDYLEHGGRIGKAAALLGSMLNVKPLIYLQDGLLFPGGKVRGIKKAMAKLIEDTAKYIAGQPEAFHIAFAHADNLKYAEQLAKDLSSALGVTFNNPYTLIGTTIGVNTGPDVGGICLIKKYEQYL